MELLNQLSEKEVKALTELSRQLGMNFKTLITMVLESEIVLHNIEESLNERIVVA